MSELTVQKFKIMKHRTSPLSRGLLPAPALITLLWDWYFVDKYFLRLTYTLYIEPYTILPKSNILQWQTLATVNCSIKYVVCYIFQQIWCAKWSKLGFMFRIFLYTLALFITKLGFFFRVSHCYCLTIIGTFRGYYYFLTFQ